MRQGIKEKAAAVCAALIIFLTACLWAPRPSVAHAADDDVVEIWAYHTSKEFNASNSQDEILWGIFNRPTEEGTFEITKDYNGDSVGELPSILSEWDPSTGNPNISDTDSEALSFFNNSNITVEHGSASFDYLNADDYTHDFRPSDGPQEEANNKNGTHTLKCRYCNVSITVAHSYQGGECVDCGDPDNRERTFSFTVPDDSDDLQFSSENNAITVEFTVKVEEISLYEGDTLTLYMTSENTNNGRPCLRLSDGDNLIPYTVTVNYDAALPDENGIIILWCSDSGSEGEFNVVLELEITESDTIYAGTTYTDTLTFSVQLDKGGGNG